MARFEKIIAFRLLASSSLFCEKESRRIVSFAEVV